MCSTAISGSQSATGCLLVFDRLDRRYFQERLAYVILEWFFDLSKKLHVEWVTFVTLLCFVPPIALVYVLVERPASVLGWVSPRSCWPRPPSSGF